MANITHNDPLVTESKLTEFYSSIKPYLGGSVSTGFTPVGTVISIMSNHAPAGYLICDGTTYNIVDYKELANHFFTEFGSTNYFGGDGTTTFAVPDLRGEFLRGTGTNSHTHGGAGLAVGVHQQATLYPYIGINTQQTKTVWTHSTGVSNEGGNGIYPLNADTQMVGYGGNDKGMDKPNGLDGAWAGATNVTNYTGRPTNTAVLYCIATHNMFMNEGSNYSTDEQIVGTWIDGKPIYQKTFTYTGPDITMDTTSRVLEIANISALNIDKIIKQIEGEARWGASRNPIPLSYYAPDLTVFADFLYDRAHGLLVLRYCRSSGTMIIGDIVATITYTKTTD